jgi:hypothetical protein
MKTTGVNGIGRVGRAVSLALVLAVGEGRAEPWRFVVMGDSRGPSASEPVNETILRELAALTVMEDPAFVLFLGDLSYQGRHEHYVAWSNALHEVHEAGIPVYPVMGNHELVPDWFVDFFGDTLPANGPEEELGRTFALTHSNALILALDSRLHRVNQEWVDSMLASNTLPHVFVASHVPAFKNRHVDGYPMYPRERDVFWESLRAAGVHAYFNAHDHFYDHARIDDGDGDPCNDIHTFTVATAGAPLVPDGAYDGDNGPYTPVRIHHDQTFGYLVVEIDGLQVRTEWVRRSPVGVYLKGQDPWAASVKSPTPYLEAVGLEGDEAIFRLGQLVPSARVTLEKDSGRGWEEVLAFVAEAPTYYYRESLSEEHGLYRLRME